MPRDGSGVASAVPGSDSVAPNTTILSALHNSMVQDIYQLFNTAWPVAYGGSGAISASNFADLNNSTSILAALLKDIGGAVTAGGTATAITATINRAYTAYGASAGQIANGTMLSLKMPLAATGAATLTLSAPSALAGKAIRRQGDTAISANDWSANSTVLLRYDTAYNAAAGAWVLLNSDAAGWAAITRAAGFDTFAATPTSANLRSLMTDETGTGALVFGTSPAIASPTISTSITSPGDFIVDSTAGTNSTFKGTKVLLWATGVSSSMELDAGTVSPGIVLTRGQLAFPAAQNASSNANTLDDYEEGTWTPSDGSGAGLSLSVASANYIKIGRLVTASFRLTYPATANGSGNVIAGLPFTSNNVVGSVGAGSSFTTLVSPNGIAINALSPNATNFSLSSVASAGNFTNAQLSSAIVAGTITYIASA